MKAVLRAGDRYVNPGDPTQSYVVGKGKPPQWFAALRDKFAAPSMFVLGVKAVLYGFVS